MPRINQQTLQALTDEELDRLLAEAFDRGQGETHYCGKLQAERSRRIELHQRRLNRATREEVMNARPGDTIVWRNALTCEIEDAYVVRVRRVGEERLGSRDYRYGYEALRYFRGSRCQRSGRTNSSHGWTPLGLDNLDWCDGPDFAHRADRSFYEVIKARRGVTDAYLRRDLDWKNRLGEAASQSGEAWRRWRDLKVDKESC
jgi:hypothetical protein